MIRSDSCVNTTKPNRCRCTVVTCGCIWNNCVPYVSRHLKLTIDFDHWSHILPFIRILTVTLWFLLIFWQGLLKFSTLYLPNSSTDNFHLLSSLWLFLFCFTWHCKFYRVTAFVHSLQDWLTNNAMWLSQLLAQRQRNNSRLMHMSLVRTVLV